MKSRIFLIYLLMFILGTFLAPIFIIEDIYFLYASFLLILLLPFFHKTKKIKHFIISIAIISFAIFHFRSFLPKENGLWTNFYIGKKVDVSGIVDSEPSGEKVATFYLKPKKLSFDNSIINNSNGKILITLRKEEKIEFGDKIKVSGALEEIESIDNTKYKDYLSKYGVYSKIDFPEAEETIFGINPSEKNWISVRKQLFKIKQDFISVIEKILPEPNASLMLGLLLGIKKSLPDELIESFKATGTMHIIALSGFNITIIVALLKNLTKNLSKRLSFWIPVSAVFFFIVMTGADSSVVRAGIMGIMLVLAKKFGRKSDATVAFIFAAFVMIFVNPLILRFDLGFQLSFASMAGIIYLSPYVEKIFIGFSEFLSENLSLTLSAQIMTLPILIYNFGTVSLISVLANLLILPAVPLAMFFGAISVLAHIVFPFFGDIFGWISYIFTDYIIKIAEILSKLPFSSVNLKLSSPYFIAMYYFMLIDGILLLKFYRRERNA